MDWRHEAICRDQDPELFFPVGNSGPAELQIAEAKAVCHRCPVASQCLAWALENGQDAGVWGGMSEDERRALKRRNARTYAKPQVSEPDWQQRQWKGTRPLTNRQVARREEIARRLQEGQSRKKIIATMRVSSSTVQLVWRLVNAGRSLTEIRRPRIGEAATKEVQSC